MSEFNIDLDSRERLRAVAAHFVKLTEGESVPKQVIAIDALTCAVLAITAPEVVMKEEQPEQPQPGYYEQVIVPAKHLKAIVEEIGRRIEDDRLRLLASTIVGLGYPDEVVSMFEDYAKRVLEIHAEDTQPKKVLDPDLRERLNKDEPHLAGLVERLLNATGNHTIYSVVSQIRADAQTALIWGLPRPQEPLVKSDSSDPVDSVWMPVAELPVLVERIPDANIRSLAAVVATHSKPEVIAEAVLQIQERTVDEDRETLVAWLDRCIQNGAFPKKWQQAFGWVKQALIDDVFPTTNRLLRVPYPGDPLGESRSEPQPQTRDTTTTGTLRDRLNSLDLDPVDKDRLLGMLLTIAVDRWDIDKVIKATQEIMRLGAKLERRRIEVWLTKQNLRPDRPRIMGNAYAHALAFVRDCLRDNVLRDPDWH